MTDIRILSINPAGVTAAADTAEGAAHLRVFSKNFLGSNGFELPASSLAAMKKTAGYLKLTVLDTASPIK